MLMWCRCESGVCSSKRFGLLIRNGALSAPLKNADPVSRTARSISDSASGPAERPGVPANDGGVSIIEKADPDGYVQRPNEVAWSDLAPFYAISRFLETENARICWPCRNGRPLYRVQVASLCRKQGAQYVSAHGRAFAARYRVQARRRRRSIHGADGVIRARDEASERSGERRRAARQEAASFACGLTDLARLELIRKLEERTSWLILEIAF